MSNQTPGGADQVVVLLSNRNPKPTNFPFPDRRITLTRAAPRVALGRASKVSAKGFVSAGNNGWFDSPVMSRHHAEMVADFNKKTVSIIDVGSTHGTWHKRKDGWHNDDVRISKDTPIILNDGDSLRFGIDVFRSAATFPPCSVDVLLDWQSKHREESTSTNHFEVPYESEIEDDALSNDDDSVEEVTMPANFSSPSKVTPRKVRVVDLTSEPDVPEVEPKLPAVPNHPAEPAVLTNEIELGVRDSVHAVTGNSDHGWTESQPYKDDLLMDDYWEDENENEDPFFVGDKIDSDDDDDVNEDGQDNAPNRYEYSDDDIRLTDSEDGGQASSSDDSENEFDAVLDQHESSLYDKTILDDDLEGSEEDEEFYENFMAEVDEDSSSGSEKSDSLSERESSPVSDSPSKGHLYPSCSSPPVLSLKRSRPDTTHVPSEVSSLPSLVPQIAQPTAVVGPAWPNDTQSSQPPRPRAPSPSDAALVKSCRPCYLPTFTASTLDVLGHKTGKFEYFAAREENRSTVARQQFPKRASAPVPAGTSQSPPTFSPSKVDEQPQNVQKSRCSHDEARISGTVSSKEDDMVSNPPESAWRASGDEFLRNPERAFSPLVSQERTHLQSPELDMTSAYQYQLSKRAAEKEADHEVKTAVQQVDRTSVPNDGVSFLSSSSKAEKRRFDEAFELSSDVEQDQALQKNMDGRLMLKLRYKSNPATTSSVQKPARPESSITHHSLMVSTGPFPSANKKHVHFGPTSTDVHISEAQLSNHANNAAVITTREHDNGRPAKRLRRFAEVIGFAALGGAAVGAGLLSTLIATAPSMT